MIKGLETLKGKKVLVTGAAGFIGCNLCEYLLNNGVEVVALDNFITGRKDNIEHLKSFDNFTFIEGDIRNLKDCEKAVKGCSVVFHQAALGSVPRSVDDPITTNEINISGFLNMLEASRKEGIHRFVYAASSSTYGDSVDLPKREEKIGKPLSPYAVTKYVNELYAQVYGDLHGLETIGLRYFNVFGRRQDPDGAYAAAIPKFVKLLMQHKSPVVYGDGEQFRDFTYIDNVIQANILAAATDNKKALNQVYNVAYGESTSVNELIQVLKELLSKYDPKIASVPATNAPMRPGEVKHSLASIDKAKNLIGYKPTHSFSQGIEEAIDWYWKKLSE